MAESTLPIETVIERRKMKRRVTFWRIAALLALALAILAGLSAMGAFDGIGDKRADHIARVKISGVITNDRPMLNLLKDLKEKDQVKGVILDISSPGGSTVGGEAMYEAVLDLSKDKPVVTSVGTMAASAGYMIASASDHIIARRSSIVGSIGVIFQYGQFSELLDKIGVEVNEIKSAPLKAEPSPFKETSPAARAMIDRLVQDTYDWFVSIVAERRGFTELKAKKLADGSIFSGAQGLENGLVDAIGDEETARQWMVSEKGLSDNLEIKTWKPTRPTDSLLSSSAGQTHTIAQRLMRKLGLNPTNEALKTIKDALPDRLFLDGLISMLLIEERPSR